MAFGESARRKLKFLLTTEPPKIHEWGQLLAEALDNDAETGQGTEAERPAAKTRGRLWFIQGETGTNAWKNGLLQWDTGSTWINVTSTVGPWEALSLGVKVEATAEGDGTPSVRFEQGGAVCRLRGTLKVKAGQTLAVNNELFSVPSTLYAPTNVSFLPVIATNVEAPFVFGIEPSPALNAFMRSVAGVAEGARLRLDGLTYPMH